MATRREPNHAGYLRYDEGRQRWRASVQVGGLRHNRLFPSRAEGQAFISSVVEAWEAKQGQARTRAQTVGSLLETWLNEVATGAKRGSHLLRSDRTMIEYRKKVQTYLQPAFGSTPISELSPDQVREWRTELLAGSANRRPLSSRTINTAQAILAAAVQLAVDQRQLPWNPVRAVKRLGVPRKSPGVALTLELWASAITRAVECLDNGGMLVLLAAGMGMRRGEALAVEWLDVHLTDPVPWLECGRSLQQVTGKGLVVTEGKNPWSHRSIAIPPFMVEILKAEQDFLLKQWVCGDRVRDPARVEQLGWYRIREAMFCPEARLHDLRHTLITHLEFQTDLSETAIKMYVGHAPTGVTQTVYTHRAPGLLPNTVAVANRIDELYRQQEQALDKRLEALTADLPNTKPRRRRGRR